MYLNVGDLVYRPYNPRSPGKVVHIYAETIVIRDPKTDRRIWSPVKIRWLDKTETIEDAHQLNKFMRLIEDHRRCLNQHKAKLPALELL